MGGVAPHAAGTLPDTARAHWPLDVLHGRSKHIRPSSVQTFWGTKGEGSHVLGWDTPSGPNSSASELWPSNGIGHLAFTGCSIWMIPERDLSVTFVSNRIHPKAYGGVLGGHQNPKYIAFRALRQEIHRGIIKILPKAFKSHSVLVTKCYISRYVVCISHVGHHGSPSCSDSASCRTGGLCENHRCFKAVGAASNPMSIDSTENQLPSPVTAQSKKCR